MAINTTHALYGEFAPAMQRTMDAYDGKVQQYVPKLTGQSVEQYNAYTNRSSYYNVVERTLSALIGALTRKNSSIEGVAGDDPLFAGDIGEDEFITQCYADMFKTGRVGLLVDFDESVQKPRVINYAGDTIINWGSDFIVLQETYFAPDPKDKYNQLLLTRYRELFIDDMGFYAVRIWEQKKTAAGNYSNVKPQYEVVETIEPVVRFCAVYQTFCKFRVKACFADNIFDVAFVCIAFNFGLNVEAAGFIVEVCDMVALVVLW